MSGTVEKDKLSRLTATFSGILVRFDEARMVSRCPYIKMHDVFTNSLCFQRNS